jgi:hypothetical protein
LVVVVVAEVVAIGSQEAEVVDSQIEETALVALKAATMGTNGECFQLHQKSMDVESDLNLQLQAEEFSDDEENLKIQLACLGNLQSRLAGQRFFLQVYDVRLVNFYFSL